MPRIRIQSAREESIRSRASTISCPRQRLPHGEVELLGANLGPTPVRSAGCRRRHASRSGSDEPPGTHRLSYPRQRHHRLCRSPHAHRRQQRRPDARCARALQRPASRHQPGREPLRNDLRDHLRPARKADSCFRSAHQPRWPRHSFRDRHTERNRPCIQPGRRSVRHLPR